MPKKKRKPKYEEPEVRVINDWCECEDQDNSDTLFADDYVCRCGCDKHHYHCLDCGKITQVG